MDDARSGGAGQSVEDVGRPDPPARGRGVSTRQRIKIAARRLFALHGLDAVSIRDIVQAAGQKNAGSVNYYFRSKEALIAELIRDGADLLERDRNHRVDTLEAAGGPRCARDILEILIHFPQPDASSGGDETALRLLNMVMINHRDLLFEALQGGADRGTRRCLAHLRGFLPELPPAIVQQRLMLLMLNLFAVSSSREAAREQPTVWRSLWGQPASDQNLVDTMLGALTCPASPETLAAMTPEAATPSLVHAARRKPHSRARSLSSSPRRDNAPDPGDG